MSSDQSHLISEGAGPMNQVQSWFEPVDSPLLATTPSLYALQTADQREALNIVDSLRQYGIDDIIPLPQLVVYGDQSSGKSSVLEAITEIPFPRKENLCTRFATEILLRCSPKALVSTKIIPDKARPAKEKKALEEIRLSTTNFSELPNLIECATEAMGVGDIGSGTGLRAFTRDVLSIKICGPDRPQLTLVILPGLIHSGNQSQSREDVVLVSELVERYISGSRTIILPIKSAKNDFANQIILDRVRSADPDGSRTLGITTKPDDLPPGSESENSFVSLVRNGEEAVTFKLGWHVLKNRGFKEHEYTFNQRNMSEASFFNKGVWAKLPRGDVGIESLRIRLSELLFKHIKKELPDLYAELEKKLMETTKELQRLGAQRSTVDEERHFLVKLSMSFHEIAKAGLNGHYDAEYFRNNEDFKDGVGNRRVRKLRAMVQYMNKRFAAQLRRRGHKYVFKGICATSPKSDNRDTESEGGNGKSALRPIVLERGEALAWVQENIDRTRGLELAGNFSPLLIGELFRQQSEKWEDIAQRHTEDISQLCTDFVRNLLKELCPQNIYARLSSKVNDILKQRLINSQAELRNIIADKKLFPMTYSYHYTRTIQKLRSQRAEENLDECIARATHKEKFYTLPETGAKGYTKVAVDRIDSKKLKSLWDKNVTLNMDDNSCSDALHCLYAYYKVALKSFTDNVAIQVIERHLVNNLEEIFSPLVVSTWPDEKISYLASEPASVLKQRQLLKGRKAALENGKAVFNTVLGARD